MTNLVEIVYVGKKPFSMDNVAGSGKLWNGMGDIQQVTEQQAKTLLKYPDQWGLVNGGDAAAIAKPVVVEVDTGTNEAGEHQTETFDVEELKKPLERMSKAELVALAKVKFGADLDAGDGKKALIDQIEELINPIVQ